MLTDPIFESSRREALIVLGFTICGAALRLWSLERLGLEHFDEGIYALAGFWIERPGGLWNLDPMVIPYAPPALPILIGLFYLVLGPTDLAAIIVSILAGMFSIPAIGWLGRRTFGPGAGAAASGILALAGPHVAFSRLALTDALFLLAWLIALGLGTRFLQRPGAGRALAFGAAVGVAQLCKYNGWLSGIVVVLTALLCLFQRSAATRKLAFRAIGWGILAAGTAALVYLPWYLFVEQHASYSALLDHHRSYLKGWNAWLPHWNVQMAQQVALSGQLVGPFSWSTIGWSLAWIGSGMVVRINPWRRSEAGRWWLGLGLGVIAFGAFPNAPWWIALLGLPWLLSSDRPAMRILGVWWMVLAILTPFYHPYARLWLPLNAASWLVVAGMIAAFLVREKAQRVGNRNWVSHQSIVFVSGIIFAAGFQIGLTPGARPLPGLLAPSDGLKIAASKWKQIRSETDLAVPLNLLARPSLTFYLLQVETEPVRIFADLESLMAAPVPGRLAMVDEVQSGRELGESLPGWSVAVLSSDSLPLPVLLDLDPSLAFGKSVSEEKSNATARIWILWTAGIDLSRTGESP